MKLNREVVDYSEANGYIATKITDITCPCDSSQFNLFSDDDEGGAYVICASCRKEQDLLNSRKYIEEACHNRCTCNNDIFIVCTGEAFYDNSNDHRWIYIGAQCPKCGLAGVYTDWSER